MVRTPNIRELSTELAIKAEKELNERPEKIQDDLDAIKSWLAKSPHINSRTDDQFLISFLRGCKYSLEKVKQKLDLYYTVRSTIPEIVSKRDPQDPKSQALIRIGASLVLPNPYGVDGPTIFLMRPGSFDAEQHTMAELFRLKLMMDDYLSMEDDNFIVAGQIVVLDLADVTWSHFVQLQPTFLKKMSMLFQNACPFRQKEIHYVNTPTGFEQFFNIIKNFMNEKISQRIFVHGDDLKSLFKHLPQQLFPQEYGGEAGTVQELAESWENKLNSYRKYFQEEDLYGTNEKKRSGTPKDAEFLFGLEGSFRKLEVD